jgi:hypothetical protein
MHRASDTRTKEVAESAGMIPGELRRIVFDECMRPGGFAFSIRENRVDEAAFDRLIGAVDAMGAHVSEEDSIDRLAVACLFELPWEIECMVDHYTNQSPELGALVSRLADRLRQSIHELLWRGLESHYEQLE